MKKLRTIDDENRVNSEYKKLLADFRPEFGNEWHIQLTHKVGLINKMERAMKTKSGAAFRSKCFEAKKEAIKFLFNLNILRNGNKLQ